MPPMKKRQYKKKGAPRRKARVPRGVNNLSELSRSNYARCSEITTLNPGGTLGQVLTANTTYAIQSSLDAAGTARAQLIARNFQEFRITKIQFRFKPLYDTFTAGAGYAGGTAPQLYMYVNRDGDVSGDSTAMIRMGINPISLAKDGNKTMTWRPSVVYRGETDQATIIKVSPWLNTQNAINTSGGGFTPNATAHYGLVFLARAIDATGSAPVGLAVGTAEIETFFEFRRPYHTTATGDALTPVVRIGV